MLTVILVIMTRLVNSGPGKSILTKNEITFSYAAHIFRVMLPATLQSIIGLFVFANFLILNYFVTCIPLHFFLGRIR